MSPRTDALKKAQKNYMEKFARVEIRMKPDERDAMQAHVKARNESVNAFIIRAIENQIKQDNERIGIIQECSSDA